jgi:hypothetical protein
MPLLLGALVAWSGYQLVVYGYQQIRGGNIGFTDLAWPGRSVALNPDQAAGAIASAQASGVGGALGFVNPTTGAETGGVSPGAGTGPGGVGYGTGNGATPSSGLGSQMLS